MKPQTMDRPLWQSNSWESFQQSLGHKTKRLKELSSKPLIIINPLFFGMHYGYIPRGPLLKDGEEESFRKELQAFASDENLIFTKIDPEIKTGLRGVKSHSVQPETTLVLDLKLSEDELLKQMKRKGRYNIGLAEKKGVIIKMAEGSEQKEHYVSSFYKLLHQTTARDKFSSHSEEYYQKMLKNVPESEVIVAFYKGKEIAGLIATFQKEKAIYYYGASSNEYREIMAPYLLQWKTIVLAKKKGCKEYDFLGIAPEDAPESHPWKGISSFKKKFGGEVQSYPQAKDIVHRPLLYKFYKVCKLLQKMIK